MRQALYGNNPLTLIRLERAPGLESATIPAKPTARRGLGRWIAHRWDLLGVLALLGTSGAYVVYALTHLGL